MNVPTILITGTVGVGKSTVADEIHLTLAELEIPNVAIDLDALICQWPPSSRWNNELMFESLAALWPVYAAHGATHLVLARVFEDPADLDGYRASVPGAEITICRLLAPEDTRVERLRRRMPAGPSLDWHLHRTGELEAILEQLAYENFAVDNGRRSVRAVAVEILQRAGWISAQQALSLM